MTMDREKEREIELESAMYTNCLLLGLDPAIIGVGASNATPRVGHFRHSNPKLGEQLLYFILSSLRGPIQSAKVCLNPLSLLVSFPIWSLALTLTRVFSISQDFDKVWPIFDSAQSRDFRKVYRFCFFFFCFFSIFYVIWVNVFGWRWNRLCKGLSASLSRRERYRGVIRGFLHLLRAVDLG